MSLKTDRVRLAYKRLKRNLTIFFTLWFLAILLAVTLIISSFFIFNNFLLKLWAMILILMMAVKIAYDAASGIKRDYDQFKEDTGQTDHSLALMMSDAGFKPPKQPDNPQQPPVQQSQA